MSLLVVSSLNNEKEAFVLIKNHIFCLCVFVLTAQGEGRQVDGDVVLIAGQFTAMTLQIIPVTGVFSHPLHLITAVGLRCHFWNAALRDKAKGHVHSLHLVL